MARITHILTAALALIAIWYALGRREDDADEFSPPVPNGSDPTPTVDISQLEQAVACPANLDGTKNVVLLVHGTGATAEVNWRYTLVPPLIARGYQPCLLDIPGRLMDDGQVSAEYVAHAVRSISGRLESSAKVSVISWSAGSLVTQWTLLFYPSVRALVRQHISIAASYKGSWIMIPLVYLNLYSPSFVQQLPSSNFVATLEKFGGFNALVPTTNIGSSTDQIVQPGFWGSSRDAWRLDDPKNAGTGAPASNIDLFKTCASLRLKQGSPPKFYLHETLLWDPASHRIIFDALGDLKTHVGSATAVQATDCRGGLAPELKDEWSGHHESIMKTLSEYAPTFPVSGWPETPLREYTQIQ
ncbi:putative lipase [Xylariaceae sp. FL0016]|nr:putative lipase [Xylariaceae sp. FL0016]